MLFIFLLVPSVLIGWIVLTGTIVRVLVVWILIVRSLWTWSNSTWWRLLLRIVLRIVLRVALFRPCYQFWWWLMCHWFRTLLFTSFNSTTNRTSAYHFSVISLQCLLRWSAELLIFFNDGQPERCQLIVIIASAMTMTFNHWLWSEFF